MAKPNSIHWATGDPAYQIEPSSGKKAVGWLAGEKPPNQYFNWMMDAAADWVDYVSSKVDNADPVILKSAGTLSWNGSDLVFGSALQIVWRIAAGASQINQFGATTLILADGEVVVVKRDGAGSSPVNLGSGTYGSLAAGQYAIVSEASLTLADIENEMILFRRSGTNLEIPYLGQIIATGTTFTIGAGGAVAAHNHDASEITSGTLALARIPSLPTSQITSGTFADARIAASNVTQHQASLALAASQITSGTFTDARVAASNVTQHQASLTLAASQTTSGTFADARIAASNVTQHQASLALAASQITSGTLAVARGGTGTTTSTGSGSVVLSGSPTFTGTLNAADIDASNDIFVGDNLVFRPSDVWIDSFVANTMNFHVGNTTGMVLTNTGAVFKLDPGSDNVYSLGSSGVRWVDVWAVDGSINTSDKREKKNIKKSDLGLDFIKKLTPVSYEWKKRKDGKRHYGLIAQEVRSALGDKNFAGLHDGDEELTFGLNYSELIGPMIQAIQELSLRIGR